MTMHWEQQYRKAVTFSYDDGNEQDEKLLEIFNDYGMKATFHVNTGLDHDHGTWQYRDRLWVHRLNLRDCPSLYRGHEVAVHGSLHQNLTELSPEALEEELGVRLVERDNRFIALTKAGAVLREEAEHLLSAASAAAARVKAVGEKNAEA